MATAPQLTHFQVAHQENARRYLLSLQAGIKPDIRPEFGRFEKLIREAEHSFDVLEPDKRRALMPKVFESIGALKQFKSFGLTGLLAGQLLDGPAATEQGEGLMPCLPEDVQLPPALAKEGCRWLAEQYVPYSQYMSPEGYADFHEDCGLFDLATISGRRVKIAVGGGQYTPLSLALVAKPGTYAKSTTAEIAIRVLRASQLDWLLGSDETTPQKLLTDMAGEHVPRQYTNWPQDKKDEFKERKAMAAQIGWYCDEFGELVKSINKPTGPMADLKKLILKFDNCPDKYTVSTVARGREEIMKPFLSFLGVMTPASIKKSARQDSEEWGDGTWSRFAFSCAPDDDGLDCPFNPERPVPPALYQPLIDWHERLGIPVVDVEEIKDKKGEQTIDYAIVKNELSELPERVIDHSAIEAHWIRYRSALKKLLQKVPEDLKASYVRLSMRALRVAALFASFEGLSHIELRHWAKAQEIAERWRLNLHRFYAQVNQNEVPTTLSRTIEEKILDYCEHHQSDSETDTMPTVRNLSRYTRAATGLLRTILKDLELAKLLKKVQRGRADIYIPYSEDG